MKVAFWSNSHTGGVTLCTVAAAIIAAGLQEMKVVIMSNHSDNYDTENALFENKWALLDCKASIFPGYDKDGYALKVADCSGRRIYRDSLLELDPGRLWLECLPRFGDSSYFETNYAGRFLNGLEEREDEYYFIDTQGSGNLCTKQILEEADLVVAILPADCAHRKLFFKEYESVLSKSLIVLNRYFSRDIDEPERLSTSYGINRERLFVLPYSDEIKRAFDSGRIYELLKPGENGREPGQYRFTAAIMQLTEYIKQNSLRQKLSIEKNEE